MSKNKKPRKKYRPPAGGVGTPITLRWAITPGQEHYLETAPWQAFAMLKTPDATIEHLCTVQSVTALAVELVKSAKDMAEESRSAAKPIAEEGKAAAMSAISRMTKTGKIGLSGPEIKAISACIELSDQLLKIATRRECRDAMRIVLGIKA